MDHSDYILKCDKHYNHRLELRLVKRDPRAEIPPPPSFHQKEVMNFKTPRCRGLNSGSGTFKISLICCDFQEIALGKAFLWPCFHFRFLHRDSISKSFKCICVQEAVSSLWSFLDCVGLKKGYLA